MKTKKMKVMAFALAMILAFQSIPAGVFAHEVEAEEPAKVEEAVILQEAPVIEQPALAEEKKEEASAAVENKEAPAEEKKEEIKEEVKEEEIKAEEIKEEAVEEVKAPVKTYTVTWKNDDGTVLQVSTVEEGQIPEFDGVPAKAAEGIYYYEFKSWSPAVVAAASNKTYKATYTKKTVSYKVTVNFTNIIKTNGDIVTMTTSNNVSKNGSWSFQQKTLDNKVTYKNFTLNGVRYTYTGQWVYDNGAPVVAPVTFKGADIDSDMVINMSPVYEKEEAWHLDFKYIDRISTGSGSAYNVGFITGYTHTFKEPAAKPHYQFVNWKNELTGETYIKGSKYICPEEYKVSGLTTNVNVYANWQPSATIQYYTADGRFLNEIEAFETLPVNGWKPSNGNGEFIGWFDEPMAASISEEDAAAEALNVLGDDAVCQLPSITVDPVERTIRKVYARYTTDYTVEHNLENLDGTYSVAETETHEDAVIGSIATAQEKDFVGFSFNNEADGTKITAPVAIGTTLRLFYSRNEYNVSYSYNGIIPAGASELPASSSYKYGALVKAADAASAPGYIFSGWDRNNFTMPAGNVQISGSFTAKDDTLYTVEHYLEELDGTFRLEESDELQGTTDTEATAIAKEYEGFSFDENAEGTQISGNIAGDGSLVLRLYYTRNSYSVSYQIDGQTPDNMKGLPETAEFKFGADVKVADNASADGFNFSGWDKADFIMPAEDVIISGSFTAIPAVIPAAIPEETPAVRPAAVTPEEVEEPAVEVIEIKEEIVPQAAAVEVMEEAAVPTAAKKVWALINLLCTIATAVISLIMALTYFRKNDEEEENEEEEDSRKKSKFFGLIPAAAAVIAFILTENMKNAMVLTDRYTLLMVIILLVNAALAFVTRNKKEDENEEEIEEQLA